MSPEAPVHGVAAALAALTGGGVASAAGLDRPDQLGNEHRALLEGSLVPADEQAVAHLEVEVSERDVSAESTAMLRPLSRPRRAMARSSPPPAGVTGRGLERAEGPASSSRPLMRLSLGA